MSIKIIDSIDNVKVSKLPEVTGNQLRGDDLFYVVNNGVSKKITYSSLAFSLRLVDLLDSIKLFIDTSIPPNPSDNRVPSTKLFKTWIDILNNKFSDLDLIYLRIGGDYIDGSRFDEFILSLNNEIVVLNNYYVSGITQLNGKLTNLYSLLLPIYSLEVTSNFLGDNNKVELSNIKINGLDNKIYSSVIPNSLSGSLVGSVDGVNLYAPNPTSVVVTQTLTVGTEIGKIKVNNTETRLYAPNPSSVLIESFLSVGNSIGTININGVETVLYTGPLGSGGGGGGSGGSSIATPVGTIIPWMGDNNSSKFPDGYLLCNGSAVSRSTYSELFAVIGTKFGSGNGSTTFNLPNLIDSRYLQGSSNAGTKVNAGLPKPTLNDPGHSHTGGYISNGNNDENGSPGGGSSNTGSSTTGITINDDDIYGNSTTVTPKSLTTLYLICYKVINNVSVVSNQSKGNLIGSVNGIKLYTGPISSGKVFVNFKSEITLGSGSGQIHSGGTAPEDCFYRIYNNHPGYSDFSFYIDDVKVGYGYTYDYNGGMSTSSGYIKSGQKVEWSGSNYVLNFYRLI